MTTVIRACLSLAVRLIDTTTGKLIPEYGIRFYKDGNLMNAINKDQGTWIFLGEDREDFLMTIDADGFDKKDIPVRYETLNPRLPMFDIFLMPSEKNRKGGSVLEIHGTLSKLESIEAVPIDRPICLFQGISERRHIVTMELLPNTQGGGIEIEEMKYAILSDDGESYEVFEVTAKQTPKSVVLKERPTREYKTNDKILRIIYGKVTPEGEFLFKVRDDGAVLNHLIRIVADGKEYFRKIDFSQETGEVDLMNGAVEAIPEAGKENEDE